MPLTLTQKTMIVRTSKIIAVLFFVLVNAADVIVAFTTKVPQIVIVAIALLSVVPYLIYLHVISPRFSE